MPDLEILNLSKTYTPSGGKVLDALSLTVHDGELFFLLGPSGCGKSTLLRILAGFVEPDSGSVRVNGREITKLSPEKRNMPMVFQNYALWPHLDVFENIAFGLKCLKKKKRKIVETVHQMLELVRMREFVHRKIPSLSGGQQQRIALARALALNPSVLLLDEPLSNLDAKLRDAMRVEIRRICKMRGLTAVYVTHDRKEALSMADRIAVLENGRVSRAGTPSEVYRRPGNRFTASFLGDVNFLSGICLSPPSQDGRQPFRTAVGTLAAGILPGDPVAMPGETRFLAFRPESVHCDVSSSSENALVGTVRTSMFLGESFYLTVELPCGEVLSVNEFSGPERCAGETLTFSIPSGRISILER